MVVVVRPKIKIRDSGKGKTTELKKKIRELKGFYVTVGLHEDAGEYPTEDAPSVVQVGFWNEFGTEKIPSRPWLRTAIDGNMGLINKWREEGVGRILEGASVESELEKLGFKIRELVRAQVNSNMPPPNAPSTTAKKKAAGIPARTLVETTLLMRSVEYKVHKD